MNHFAGRPNKTTVLSKRFCVLGGSEGLSRLITPISHVVARVLPMINLLTKSP